VAARVEINPKVHPIMGHLDLVLAYVKHLLVLFVHLLQPNITILDLDILTSRLEKKCKTQITCSEAFASTSSFREQNNIVNIEKNGSHRIKKKKKKKKPTENHRQSRSNMFQVDSPHPTQNHLSFQPSPRKACL
jgi:hypothetical protein